MLKDAGMFTWFHNWYRPELSGLTAPLKIFQCQQIQHHEWSEKQKGPWDCWFFVMTGSSILHTSQTLPMKSFGTDCKTALGSVLLVCHCCKSIWIHLICRYFSLQKQACSIQQLQCQCTSLCNSISQSCRDYWCLLWS